MKTLITLFLILGILSFGFINEEQSLLQSFAFVGTGLFFLMLAAHLDERYQKLKNNSYDTNTQLSDGHNT